jgi:hypothetical protein
MSLSKRLLSLDLPEVSFILRPLCGLGMPVAALTWIADRTERRQVHRQPDIVVSPSRVILVAAARAGVEAHASDLRCPAYRASV